MYSRMISFVFLASLSAPSYSADAVQLDSRFSTDDVAWFRHDGSNTLSGSATLRLKNGEFKRCDGFSVELLPAATYANERVQKTYGNTTAGQVLVADKPPKFSPDSPAYHETVRKTKCDDSGQFRFARLPDGEYYTFAFIIWPATDAVEADHLEGGAVMQHIVLKAGKDVQILRKN